MTYVLGSDSASAKFVEVTNLVLPSQNIKCDSQGLLWASTIKRGIIAAYYSSLASPDQKPAKCFAEQGSPMMYALHLRCH